MKTTSSSKAKKQAKSSATARMQLSAAIDKIKRAIADYLNEKTERLSTRGKKVSLAIFGTVMGIFCLVFLLKPFQVPSDRNFVLPSRLIQKPLIEPLQDWMPSLRRSDYEKLRAYKKMLDSLVTLDPATYDKVMHGRTRWLDSINILLELYPNE